MEQWKDCPCTGCQRVTDPDRCDNKECMRWRKWFIGRWDQLRNAWLDREGKA